MYKIREVKHRLQSDCYQGYVRVFFTLCIKDKRQVFVNNEIVSRFVEILNEAKNKYE